MEDKINIDEIKNQATKLLTDIGQSFIEGLKTDNYKAALDTVDNLSEMTDTEFEELLEFRLQPLDEFDRKEFERVKLRRMQNWDNTSGLSYRQVILLDLQAMLSSNEFRNRHQAEVSSVNIEKLSKIEPNKTEQLAPEEIRFLSKIDKKDISLYSVPGYFTHQYHLNFQSVLEKLFSYGYLTFTDEEFNLSKATVTQLKNLLNQKGLSTKGSKPILIKSILNNYTITEINNSEIKKYFVLTDSGYKLLKQNDALLLYYNAFNNCKWTDENEIIAEQLLHPNWSGSRILAYILSNYISVKESKREYLSSACYYNLDQLNKMQLGE